MGYRMKMMHTAPSQRARVDVVDRSKVDPPPPASNYCKSFFLLSKISVINDDIRLEIS